MLDLIVLFTLFVGLVLLLAAVHQWQVSRAPTGSPAASKRLLDEWMQAHKLELPGVQCILSILNRRLQELESEDWEKIELRDLLPRTELPLFELFEAQLSEDGRDITLGCYVEWPLCVPGVEVSVLVRGSEQPLLCHFMWDWLEAKICVVFGEKNGVLMLSYQNMQDVKMGVTCVVPEGQGAHSVKECERVASFVAEAVQEVIADLQLEQVPLVSLYGRTPSLPLLLVSSPEETMPCNQSEATPTKNQEDSDPLHTDGAASNLLTQQSLEMTTPLPLDIITPLIEEVEPICDVEDKAMPLLTRAASSPEQLTNGLSHVVPPPLPLPSSVVEDPPASPSWRRTSSYENLEAIPLWVTPKGAGSTPKRVKLKGSTSSDYLASPTHNRVSSPLGRGTTLSMSGSEAESIYGADERIPSSLVFEVRDSIKVRHIVAMSTAHASKLRRHFSNAKKLHIYNDHSFMATHLKTRADCAVCKEKISKLFGKQGYVCRDCDVVVHKQCHFKVESSCPTSTVSSMNLIYPETTSVSDL